MTWLFCARVWWSPNTKRWSVISGGYRLRSRGWSPPHGRPPLSAQRPLHRALWTSVSARVHWKRNPSHLRGGAIRGNTGEIRRGNHNTTTPKKQQTVTVCVHCPNCQCCCCPGPHKEGILESSPNVIYATTTILAHAGSAPSAVAKALLPITAG